MMAKPSDDKKEIQSPSGDARHIADIEENLKQIRFNIEEACIKAGRDPREVTLLGVTKTVSPVYINAAIDAGLTAIGENRVQEFLGKRDEIKLDGIDVHLIGHLQTNKVSKIVGKVDMIESIDSLRLADAVSKASERAGIVTDVLVEVNIGREESKSGVMEEELEELASAIGELRGIRLRGLMTIPPILDTESEKRAIFAHVHKLFIDIRGKNIDNVNMGSMPMDVLSMGMSSDYREAVMEGATIVRVGSALFGRRR
jgi:pyridoxal phosphate enzyme (YggS family)